MSSQIYSAECDLLTLQNEYVEILDPIQYLSSSSVMMNMAAYVYLYLILRELPIKSQLFYRLTQRLREALEMQNVEWWNSTQDRQRWMLWVLFLGYAASSEWPEKWWFVERMEPLGAVLMVWTKDELRSALKGVLWQDLCEDFLEKLWKDVSQPNRIELDA